MAPLRRIRERLANADAERCWSKVLSFGYFETGYEGSGESKAKLGAPRAGAAALHELVRAATIVGARRAQLSLRRVKHRPFSSAEPA